MKKFLLTTEYGQQELQDIIEQSVQKAIKQELQTIIPQLANPPPSSYPPKLLTRHDLKKILRVSYPTIISLEKKGLLKGSIISGSYRYTEKQVEKLINQNKNIKNDNQ